MKVEVRKSFVKDSQRLPLQNQARLAELIESISNFKTAFDIPHCKKMQGYKNAYRIKFGEYRIGFFRESNAIEFVRILATKRHLSVFSVNELIHKFRLQKPHSC